MARDIIELEGLNVSCVLGVLPEERDREQPIRVDLRLSLDLVPAGRSASIGDTIDYDRVAHEIAALLRFRRYRLLENAAEELAAMLLGVHPALEGLELRLAKPEALRGRADAAAVRVARSRGDFERRREITRFGEVEVLLETKEAGLYLLHVAAGRQIPLHHHQVMRELEWLVNGSLQQDGERVPLARPVEWPHGLPHAYRNDGDEVATLFCCDCPPFIPEDEIELAGSSTSTGTPGSADPGQSAASSAPAGSSANGSADEPSPSSPTREEVGS